MKIPTEPTRVQIEQAVARGLTPETIAQRLNVTLATVDLVLRWMDEAADLNKPTGLTGPREIHGTYYGYRKHLRTGSKPCDACKAAYRTQRMIERRRGVA